MSLVCRRFRALIVRQAFSHVCFTITAKRLHQLHQLSLSPLAEHIQTITYKVPAHPWWPASLSDAGQVSASLSERVLLQATHDAIYSLTERSVNLSGIRIQFLCPGQFFWPSHSYLKAIIPALAQAHGTRDHLQYIYLDTFNIYETVESLGLAKHLNDAFLGVSNVHIRGQYRFWDSALGLGIFQSVTTLTLDDCTVHHLTLQRFLRSKSRILGHVRLIKVTVLPYTQLGLLSRCGTNFEIVSWFTKGMALAKLMTDHWEPNSTRRDQKSVHVRRSGATDLAR
jgi:hypothetical protein